MKSENKNFILNVVYQLLIYIFPLITTPYISRVLGVNNVGIYSYTYSIVSLFMLAALLGINNYGNRETARVRDNQDRLNKKFSSIYTLQLFISITTLMIYYIYIVFFCKKYKEIAFAQSIFLISTCFDVNWFYFGLEKFKLTISRNVLIKVISIICIFLFVRSRSDLWKYTVIMAVATLISQLYLIIILHKYVKFVKVGIKEAFSNFKQVLILFIPVLAYGIYGIMDKTMIGLMSTTVQLGNYENAQKIVSIPISIITALGTVMLPRMSYVLKDKNADFKPIIKSSMKLALVMSTTMTFGIILVSKEISAIMFGSEFTESSMIMSILSLYLVFTAWANVIRTQYLIPTRNDKIYVESTLFGAIVNLVFNLTFIPKYGAYGACIGTILAEVSVMLWQTIKARNSLEIKQYIYIYIECLWKSIIMFAFAFVSSYFFHGVLIKFVIKVGVSVIVFVLLNYKFIWFEFLGRKELQIIKH